MFKKIKELEERINALSKEINSLRLYLKKETWLREHPPKFKYGDHVELIQYSQPDAKVKVRVLDVKLEEHHKLGYFDNEERKIFCWVYVVDTGKGITEVNESGLR